MTVFRRKEESEKVLPSNVVQLLEGDTYQLAATENRELINYDLLVDYLHIGPFGHSIHSLIDSWIVHHQLVATMCHCESRKNFNRCVGSLERDAFGRPNLTKLADKQSFILYLGEICIEPEAPIERRISQVVALAITHYLKFETVH